MEERVNIALRKRVGADCGAMCNEDIDELILEAVNSRSIDQITSFLQRLLSEDIPSQVAKSGLLSFAKCLRPLSVSAIGSERELFHDAAHFIISAVKQQSSAVYDEPDFLVREALFDYYVGEEDYIAAAQYLSNANLESTVHSLSERDKADVYVKCAEAVLEGDAAVDAEAYMNKASTLINSVDKDVALQLRFRVTYARVLDANRKFVEASLRYYELSTTTSLNVLQDDLLELLAKAVTCAVLGKPGAPRRRVLTLLYQDSRLSSLDCVPKYSSHSSVLTKTHNEQILKKNELANFEAALMPHQTAMTSEGYTLLEKAVIEHNMLAMSRVFSCIGLAELAQMVSLNESQAEKVMAAMITERRLNAIIDQTEGVVIFSQSSPDDVIFRTKRNISSLEQWDSGIQLLCGKIASFAERAQAKYPSQIRCRR